MQVPVQLLDQIALAKLNRDDPQGWLKDTLALFADHKIAKLDELMTWSYAQN